MPDQTSDSIHASNAAAEQDHPPLLAPATFDTRPGAVNRVEVEPRTDPVAKEKSRADAAQAEQDRIAANPPGFVKGSNYLGAAPPVDRNAPVTAATKLRDFEHEVFGRDAPRINGDLERGVGSPWANMTPYQKAHHASLEQLVKAEKAVSDASADLETARLKHDAAVKVSEAAAKAIAEADAVAKKQADKDRIEADRLAAQNPPHKAD